MLKNLLLLFFIFSNSSTFAGVNNGENYNNKHVYISISSEKYKDLIDKNYFQNDSSIYQKNGSSQLTEKERANVNNAIRTICNELLKKSTRGAIFGIMIIPTFLAIGISSDMIINFVRYYLPQHPVGDSLGRIAFSLGTMGFITYPLFYPPFNKYESNYFGLFAAGSVVPLGMISTVYPPIYQLPTSMTPVFNTAIFGSYFFLSNLLGTQIDGLIDKVL